MNALSITHSEFLGHWRIERAIDDRLNGKRGTFTGTALIQAKNEEWVYTEDGTLAFDQLPPMKAERRYTWQPCLAGFDIYFDDKRFFHKFVLDHDSRGWHQCADDLYEVGYSLMKWPVWSAVWTVNGPAKRYVMTSIYTRVEGD